jgi:hypothetical protein
MFALSDQEEESCMLLTTIIDPSVAAVFDPLGVDSICITFYLCFQHLLSPVRRLFFPITVALDNHLVTGISQAVQRAVAQDGVIK